MNGLIDQHSSFLNERDVCTNIEYRPCFPVISIQQSSRKNYPFVFSTQFQNFIPMIVRRLITKIRSILTVNHKIPLVYGTEVIVQGTSPSFKTIVAY